MWPCLRAGLRSLVPNAGRRILCAANIAISAAVHLLSNLDTVPGRLKNLEPMLEFDCTENPLRDELIVPLFIVDNGKVKVPEQPGLGIDVNENILNKYRVE